MVARKRLRTIFFAVALFTIISSARAEDLTWHGYVKLETIDNFHGVLKNGWNLAGGTRIYGKRKVDWCLGAIPIDTVPFGLLAVARKHKESVFSPTVQNISSLTTKGVLTISDLAIWSHYTDNFMSRIGIMDLEDYFTIVDNSSFLINSGFGNPMAVDANTLMVTFPYPGLGAMCEYNNHNTKLMAGIYQGNPQRIRSVFYQGYMLLAEIDQTFKVQSDFLKDYAYKIGGWQYQQSDLNLGGNSVGLYIIAHTTLNSQMFQNFAAFGEFSFCVSQEDPDVPAGLNLGIEITGLFPQRTADIFSCGLARVWLHDKPTETVYEASYSFNMVKQCYLIADLQYIHRPSGIYKNAWAALLRLLYTI